MNTIGSLVSSRSDTNDGPTTSGSAAYEVHFTTSKGEGKLPQVANFSSQLTSVIHPDIKPTTTLPAGIVFMIVDNPVYIKLYLSIFNAVHSGTSLIAPLERAAAPLFPTPL